MGWGINWHLQYFVKGISVNIFDSFVQGFELLTPRPRAGWEARTLPWGHIDPLHCQAILCKLLKVLVYWGDSPAHQHLKEKMNFFSIPIVIYLTWEMVFYHISKQLEELKMRLVKIRYQTPSLSWLCFIKNDKLLMSWRRYVSRHFLSGTER